MFVKKIMFSKTSRIYPNNDDNRKIIIMGNGPSLNKDLDSIIKQREECKLYSVNNFPLTKEFFKLRPNIYVFSDPMYWSQNVNNKVATTNELLYKSLNKVNWPLTIVCPSHGSSYVQNLTRNNNQIKIESVTPRYVQLHSMKLTILALQNNLITPNFVDVAILAIWHALHQPTDNIDLYGLDGTSFNEFDVDQLTNQVVKRGAHFYNYNENKLPEPKKYPKQESKKLYERFYQVWLKFTNFHHLSILATSWGKKIRNLSSYSVIDSFDRN